MKRNLLNPVSLDSLLRHLPESNPRAIKGEGVMCGPSRVSAVRSELGKALRGLVEHAQWIERCLDDLGAEEEKAFAYIRKTWTSEEIRQAEIDAGAEGSG